MKPAPRPSTPADAAAITALFAEAGMDLDPDHLHWKYWQPRADWPGPRSFVIASGTDVIAHAGIVPGSCAWGTRRETVIHVIDWVARASTGVGVMLMKHVGQMAGVLIAIGGGPDTRSILPHIGFRPAGSVTAYARPLFALRILRTGPAWKVLPRLARAAWRRSARAAPDPDWQVRRLGGDEVGQIATVLPRPTHGSTVTERNADQLRYFLTCPIVPMKLYAVSKAGRLRGYFLLALAPGQVRIADCWVDSEESEDWRATILCAVELAQDQPQAAEVVTWASDPLLATALRACGFYARSESPIQVRPSGNDTGPAGPLRVQLLDNDDAYLFYQGRNEYWG
jgi:hypothetical protein